MSSVAARRQARPLRRIGFLEVVAELAITAGVLILLYAFWSLWFNNLLVSNEQRDVAVSVNEQWTLDLEETPLPPLPPGEVPVLPTPESNELYANLKVPRWGSDYTHPIYYGNTPRLLTKGIATYLKTQLPGEYGNYAIAGHRTTWGSPFHNIDKLQIGDAIVVETSLGWYTYRFRSSEYVWATGVSVLNPVPQSNEPAGLDRFITLTSCHPKFSAAERFIAYGVFESFTPRTDGPPASLAAVVS